jgi:predicted AlkP superfamily pyrophosphatase or phosphodiesterase
MRVVLLLLFVAALAVGGYFAYRHFGQAPTDNGTPHAEKPKAKLVVLVVFDQMQGDYLSRWSNHFGPGGFERMKQEGVWYTDAQIPYACTSTGPGHASLVTGAPPAVTGIVENEWWDRKVPGRVYCCQPTGRPYKLVPPPPDAGPASRGTDTGFSPERLLAETVGDKLKAATDGKARVFSLSIKDRTAVLMGGRKPDGVYCFDTRDGLFHTGEYYREQVHSWVSAFNAEKPADEWFKQKWEKFRDLDYKAAVGQPDEAPGEAYGFNGQGRLFPHPFNAKLTEPGPDYYVAVEGSPAGNELLYQLATKAIVAEKLGQGETTDLLCLSFSSNDLIGHVYGPDSWEVFDITLRSDKLIADLLAFLDTTVGKDRYTLVVTADHGVCPLPELERYPTARRVSLTDKKNEIFAPLAAKLNDAYGMAPTGPTQWFESATANEQERVWPWVYLNHTAIKARGLDVEEVALLTRDWLSGRGYMEAAFTRKEIEKGDFPPGSIGAKVKFAYHPYRCGDVIAVPKLGVLVTRYDSGTTHGSPHRYDIHVPILAFGAGVPALGKQDQKVSSLIVAPILAKALGIDPPKDAMEKAPF